MEQQNRLHDHSITSLDVDDHSPTTVEVVLRSHQGPANTMGFSKGDSQHMGCHVLITVSISDRTMKYSSVNINFYFIPYFPYHLSSSRWLLSGRLTVRCLPCCLEQVAEKGALPQLLRPSSSQIVTLAVEMLTERGARGRALKWGCEFFRPFELDATLRGKRNDGRRRLTGVVSSQSTERGERGERAQVGHVPFPLRACFGYLRFVSRPLRGRPLEYSIAR